MAFGLEIGFIDHFNTLLATTLIYSAISDLHILQITAGHAKSLQSAVSNQLFSGNCFLGDGDHAI
jgi:hypothetical protein